MARRHSFKYPKYRRTAADQKVFDSLPDDDCRAEFLRHEAEIKLAYEPQPMWSLFYHPIGYRVEELTERMNHDPALKKWFLQIPVMAESFEVYDFRLWPAMSCTAHICGVAILYHGGQHGTVIGLRPMLDYFQTVIDTALDQYKQREIFLANKRACYYVGKGSYLDSFMWKSKKKKALHAIICPVNRIAHKVVELCPQARDWNNQSMEVVLRPWDNLNSYRLGGCVWQFEAFGCPEGLEFMQVTRAPVPPEGQHIAGGKRPAVLDFGGRVRVNKPKWA